jgi:hypothetical protein
LAKACAAQPAGNKGRKAMKKIFGLTVLFLIAQCGCNSAYNQTTEPKDKNETASKSNSENNKTESNISKESAAKNAEKYRNDPQSFSWIYGMALTNVVYGNEFGNSQGHPELGYKRETVPPANPEKLRTFKEVKASTIENFIERNRTTERLRSSYDVKYIIQVVDGNDSYEKLLARFDQKVFGVVGLSKAGFSEDFTQSLIYVEFYGHDKLLQRKYLMTTWDISGVGAHEVASKWFSAE